MIYIEKTDKLYNEIKVKIRDILEKGYFGNIYETTNVYEKSKLILKIRSYTIIVDIYKSGKGYINGRYFYKLKNYLLNF